MSEFLDILKLEWGPVKYELQPQPFQLDNNIIRNWHLKMVGYDFPRAVHIKEFDFLKKLIIDYDLKSGYECATAFGVSTVALGLGFLQTGGKLISMDAYIEEIETESIVYDKMNRYRYDGKQHNTNSMGFKSANFLIEHFRLKNVVKLEIGYSPDDVGNVVQNNLNKKLDFVFIDAGHFPEQLIKDLESIRQFLDDEYVIVLHDSFPWLITPEVEEFLITNFGKTVDLPIMWPDGYNMGVIINKTKKN
jgi:hypothetical protein